MAFVFWFGVIYVVMTMVTRGSRRALDFVNALFELWIGRWNFKVHSWSVCMETEFCNLFPYAVLVVGAGEGLGMTVGMKLRNRW